MLRGFYFVALCALPLAISAPAAAQSFIEVIGGPEVAAPTPHGPPMSITELYTPRSAAARDLSLLVDELQVVATAPVASISVTSSAPATPAVLASNDLSTSRSSVTVSNVRGFHEQE